MADETTSRHIPILAQPIVDALIEPFARLSPDEGTHWLVDCTLGGGGHSSLLLEALGKLPGQHKLLAVDQDPQAVDRGRERFAQAIREGKMEVLHSRFGELVPALEGRKVLGMMADLGFSSDQIEDSERGLSFMHDGPLDMRLDPTRGESCREMLARIQESDLADILFQYAEERYSRRIAHAILERRREGRLPTTSRELAEVISHAVPAFARHGRIHAATRSFQALRIAVNDELEELDSLLDRVILSLEPRGRVAILSFHSLEDRKVKQTFKPKEAVFRQTTKKPIEADDEELKRNPRSRSAKLRIAERIP